jgi:c-di-GMP-binding flagellar brake protein YcgR
MLRVTLEKRMSDDYSRRRHPRIETQQHVWVEGQDVRVSAETRNISKGGMFVVAEGEAPAIGTTLQVQFEDPHEGTINVKMEVVWREEKTITSNLGLRAMDSRGMAAFERVVQRLEQKPKSLQAPEITVHDTLKPDKA